MRIRDLPWIIPRDLVCSSDYGNSFEKKNAETLEVVSSVTQQSLDPSS